MSTTTMHNNPPFALGSYTRHSLGILCLAITVILWTASNFLASSLFADETFSKPYFVTYLNTAAFAILLPLKSSNCLLRSLRGCGSWTEDRNHNYTPVLNVEHVSSSGVENDETHDQNSDIDSASHSNVTRTNTILANDRSFSFVAEPMMGLRETFFLSLEFCLLWFAANFLQAKGLEYTTVASATIIMSTSGVWTLVIGSAFRVEAFTRTKLLGVLASTAGIALICSTDLSGEADKNRGSFPHKSTTEIASGDLLALGSAIIYAIYTTLMKKRIKDETRIDVLIFLGFVGLINTLILWPGFFIMQYSRIEEFEVPPTSRIWYIILCNALISVVSDLSWAYAVLLTSPLVVTVGLSLSIPLSIAGQIFLHSQTFVFSYVVGAVIVFVAFIYVNSESTRREG